MSYGGQDAVDYSTARGRDWPSVRQFSVFVQNRVGSLMDLVRKIESSQNRIVALMVVDSADCSIVRVVLSEPERACETFNLGKLPFYESDLLVVQIPAGSQPLAQICKALLAAEINIHYAYPLLIEPKGHAGLAMMVDEHETAVATLQKLGFKLFTEADLQGTS